MSIARVKNIKDAEKRARAAAKLLAPTEEKVRDIRAVMDEAAQSMLNDGATFADVARAIGITRSAVAQRFSKPERPSA
ncbi:hypothetical protein [Phycicoccus sp.]|uniref:hypothetical protein n=1 Tax=Phycicoccus sp. TaxID=1902410 RepID=UPI002B9F428E|nr:hypothetical protein [Phycicoccus sp.]HMM95379.1 hypothetical protein [Phycicoccus sp.]